MRRRPRHWVVMGVNVAAIMVCLLLAGLFRTAQTRAESVQRIELSGELTAVSEAGPVGERVLNILMVGSDSDAGLDPDDPIRTDRQGEHNGDVIIIAHVDERSRSAALVSIPRDTWVDIPGASSQRINAAFSIGGPALLVETIEDNLDIPIHHYVNVDFAGFQGLVAAVDYVEVPFATPARDFNPALGISQTGFEVPEAGCVALDPETSLSYVRSRYYQTMRPDGTWQADLSSDLGRIQRQQDFLTRFTDRAIQRGARNPFVLRELVDAGLSHVVVDQELSGGDLLDLLESFRNLDGGDIRTYQVPVTDALIDGREVLEVVPAAAEPLLALLRGGDPLGPGSAALHYGAVTDADGDASPDLAEIADSLPFASTTAVRVSDAPPGLTLAHRAEDLALADEIRDLLGVNASSAIDDALPARTLRLTWGPSVEEPESTSDPVTESEAEGADSADEDVPDSESVNGSAADDADGPDEGGAVADSALVDELATCGE